MGQDGKSEVTEFKCPNCGGEGYFQSHKAGWVLAGKIRPAASVGCAMTLTQVLDKTVPALMTPTVRAIDDICENCGTRFVSQLTLGEMPNAQILAPPNKGRGFKL